MGRTNSTRRGLLPTPEIRPDDSTLTRFAGAIPLIAFMTKDLRLVSRLNDVVRYRGRRRRYGPHVVLFAFIVAALMGVRRLAHLDWLKDDAVLVKWLRLPSWPVRKVFSMTLAAGGPEMRARLEQLVGVVGVNSLPKGTTSLVIDTDNTALVAHGRQERAEFGYCGKGRRRRRHYPFVASVAETRAIVAVKYRGGEGLRTPEVLEFFGHLVARLVAHLGTAVQLHFRGDSGLATLALMAWFQEQGHAFTFALAMKRHIKPALHRATWVVDPDDDEIEFTAIDGLTVGMHPGVRVIGIRRRDDDPSEPAQGKLLPGCHRYQTLVTSTDWEPRDVWRFYNHRADCERVFRTGKQAIGMAHLVGQSFDANATAFLLRCLAFNADLRFQQHAEQTAAAQGRKVRHVGLEWRQFRFYCSPGRLLREHCRWVLRVPTNTRLAELWRFYLPDSVMLDAGGPA